MTKNKFSFDRLGDLVAPKDMMRAGFGGKTAVYALFHREDFPAIRHGKKFMISKKALIKYFNA